MISPTHAQVSYTSTMGAPYTQNFNTLLQSGSLFPENSSANEMSGWYAYRANASNIPTLLANNGSSGAGGLYSFGYSTGVTGSGDRALGSIGSTDGGFVWAVQIQNNTGSAITAFTVQYAGEQWRYSVANTHTLEFSFGVFSSGSVPALGTTAPLGTGVNNFASVANMNFDSPETDNGLNFGQLDGNFSGSEGNLGNRAIRTTTINATIPAGHYVWFRWNDVNHPGNDHALATDDFSFTATQFQPVPAPPAAVSLGIGGLVALLVAGAKRLRARRKQRR